ncbi:type II toxin-antitoxin system RelE/ParE family toxin [Crocosphaera chwakensis]|uniref:Type II toxin-antitoxin system RelE/ParE family toxin n=1 Tax=Crocosphaera chwakensis CCY0110 TaxID=391612 RepID=A3IZL8_9CHRO|nr:type II toxin-antitoxin system RelE/ParE family toxin [Crocosphaera chwakensis]EAZ88073.1 hypothetical protein CY0110_31965 [Crocosphaera chwakensis CCY0110]
MPRTEIIFYQEKADKIPVLDWLNQLKRQDKKGFAKCVARIQQLQDFGHELRRPASDFLRDGIWELRIRQGKIQYRILYFFDGQNIAILGHALVKKGEAVSNADINKAIQRKEKFSQQPQNHTYEGEI